MDPAARYVSRAHATTCVNVVKTTSLNGALHHLTGTCFLKTYRFGDFHHHNHHHISSMELGHLLTRSGLTYPEVSSKVYHDSFCQLGSSISLPWVICFEAFYLHVVSSFSCIPVICPKLVLFLTPS